VDSSRLRTGEIVAGIGGVAMFVFLFFDWFGGGAQLTGNPGNLSISQPGVSGWDALVDVPGFVIILSALSGIALSYLAAAGQRVNIPVERGAVTAYLGGLAVLLILWRMFAGSPTLKIGIFLGLAAAVTVTAGAVMALREDGYALLVSVPGGRTRVAAATAPPATPAAAPTEEVPANGESASSSGGSSSTGSTATKKPAGKKSSSSSAKKSSSSTARKSSASKPRKRSSSAKSRSSGSSKSRSSSSAKKSGSSRSSGSKSGGSRKRSSGGRKK
jgi:hypothetical protein